MCRRDKHESQIDIWTSWKYDTLVKRHVQRIGWMQQAWTNCSPNFSDHWPLEFFVNFFFSQRLYLIIRTTEKRQRCIILHLTIFLSILEYIMLKWRVPLVIPTDLWCWTAGLVSFSLSLHNLQRVTNFHFFAEINIGEVSFDHIKLVFLSHPVIPIVSRWGVTIEAPVIRLRHRYLSSAKRTSVKIFDRV